MKKLLLSFFMLFVGLIGMKAQANMYFTISGTSVTFKVIPTSPGDWGGL